MHTVTGQCVQGFIFGVPLDIRTAGKSAFIDCCRVTRAGEKMRSISIGVSVALGTTAGVYSLYWWFTRGRERKSHREETPSSEQCFGGADASPIQEETLKFVGNPESSEVDLTGATVSPSQGETLKFVRTPGEISSELDLAGKSVSPSQGGNFPGKEEFEYDIVVLHSDFDRKEAISFMEHLDIAIDMQPQLSAAIFEELSPEIQSRIQSSYACNVFSRVRLVFVFVSAALTKDGLKRHQAEMLLNKSLECPKYRNRMVPVWTEDGNGTHTVLEEYDILKGIGYFRFQNGDERDRRIYVKNMIKMVEFYRKEYPNSN
ncbi:hypothetical protein ScPMuIL_002960 [Solemya velum]